MIEIVTTVQRPDLVPGLADWAWREWGRPEQEALAEIVARGTAIAAEDGFERQFVVLDDAVPVAMSALVREDLDERPNLTPWLAGVFVHPAHRGRGHGVRVVQTVENAARAAGVATLWLYTSTASGLYRRLGWHDHEAIARPGKSEILVMRREL